MSGSQNGAEAVDVVVVGAGPVGLAAAIGFARAGYSVRLVGPAPLAADGRTAALLDGSVRLLEELGAWQNLVSEAAPLRVMRLVDDTDSLFRPPPLAFRSEEIGLDAFGWNIENATLATALATAANSTPGITWSQSLATGFSIGGASGRACVEIDGGDAIAARLVVAADGRRSRMREAAGLRTRTHAYPQRALTTLLRHTGEHHDTSTEFHTRAGPFTLVPLPGRRSSLVWVTSLPHAARLSALSDSDLARAVERQSHGLLGRIEIDGPRGLVPLGRLSVTQLAGPRLALLGEAAHVLPPIGAQGLNLGFADVATLLQLVGALPDGSDPGERAVLRRYEAARRGDIRLRGAAVDGLNRALLSDLLPVDALRGLGLGLLARVGPLRRFVMQAGLTRPALTARTAARAPSRS